MTDEELGKAIVDLYLSNTGGLAELGRKVRELVPFAIVDKRMKQWSGRSLVPKCLAVRLTPSDLSKPVIVDGPTPGVNRP